MEISRAGIDFIALHEGFRSRAYHDAATPPVLTIGYGFTWRSTSFRSWWARNRSSRFNLSSTMSEDEAKAALQMMIADEYGKAVNEFLGHKQVPQHVFDAAVSAVFNLGPRALTWKWAAAMKAGDYAAAAARLRVTGTTAGGRRLAGLVRRRKEEALLLEKGIYTGVTQPKGPFNEAQKAVDAPFLLPADYHVPTQQQQPRGFWAVFRRVFGFNRP